MCSALACVDRRSGMIICQTCQAKFTWIFALSPGRPSLFGFKGYTRLGPIHHVTTCRLYGHPHRCIIYPIPMMQASLENMLVFLFFYFSCLQLLFFPECVELCERILARCPALYRNGA